MSFGKPVHVLILALALLAATQSAAARQDAVSRQPLLEVELPAAAIPEGPVSIQLAHWTWEPGATASIPAGAWQRGIVIDHVLTGSYAATSGDAVLLVCGRAPNTAEEIAPETEFIVDAGSGAAYLQNAARWEFRSSGPDTGAGLGGGIFSTAPPENNVPTSEIGIGYEELASTELESWDLGNGESATFTYWTATLAPGDEIAAPPDGAVQLVGLLPNAATSTKLTTSPDGTARNDGAASIVDYGMTLTP